MRLLIKQRVFSLIDSYDVYDEQGNPKYFVKAEFFKIGHQLRVYDTNHNEVGKIKQQLFNILPVFEIEVQGRYCGCIRKKFAFFKPTYEVDYCGWRVEGDLMAWNYEVYEACSAVMYIHRELFRWGDTYVVDFSNPQEELPGLMLVIAIDAANSISNNTSE